MWPTHWTDATVMYQSLFPNGSLIQIVQNHISFCWFTDTVDLVSAPPTSSPFTSLRSLQSFFLLSASGSSPSWELYRFYSCYLESLFPETLHSSFSLDASGLLWWSRSQLKLHRVYREAVCLLICWCLLVHLSSILESSLSGGALFVFSRVNIVPESVAHSNYLINVS